MRCGNDPRAQLTPGDLQTVDDFKAWLKAKSDGTRDDLLRAAAEQLRPSSPAVAAHTVFVKLPPAAADALADLFDMCADARGRFPYEVFIVARRLLDASTSSGAPRAPNTRPDGAGHAEGDHRPEHGRTAHRRALP
ncbi:MAG: hypothetical protein ACRDXB_03535 [Actinomycetes bacterium]